MTNQLLGCYLLVIGLLWTSGALRSVDRGPATNEESMSTQHNCLLEVAHLQNPHEVTCVTNPPPSTRWMTLGSWRLLSWVHMAFLWDITARQRKGFPGSSWRSQRKKPSYNSLSFHCWALFFLVFIWFGLNWRICYIKTAIQGINRILTLLFSIVTSLSFLVPSTSSSSPQFLIFSIVEISSFTRARIWTWGS